MYYCSTTHCIVLTVSAVFENSGVLCVTHHSQRPVAAGLKPGASIWIHSDTVLSLTYSELWVRLHQDMILVLCCWQYSPILASCPETNSDSMRRCIHPYHWPFVIDTYSNDVLQLSLQTEQVIFTHKQVLIM